MTDKNKAALDELKQARYEYDDPIYGGAILSSDGLHIVLSKETVDACIAALSPVDVEGLKKEAIAFLYPQGFSGLSDKMYLPDIQRIEQLLDHLSGLICPKGYVCVPEEEQK